MYLTFRFNFPVLVLFKNNCVFYSSIPVFNSDETHIQLGSDFQGLILETSIAQIMPSLRAFHDK